MKSKNYKLSISILLSMIFFSPCLINAQDQKPDELIENIVHSLFEAMRNSDGKVAASLFEKNARLYTVFVDEEGKTPLREGKIHDFIEAIAKPKTDIWDERISSYDIKIDGPLAKVWTPYSFYINETLSHCGVNDFELIRRNGSWKINRIIDTRRKKNCLEF